MDQIGIDVVKDFWYFVKGLI